MGSIITDAMVKLHLGLSSSITGEESSLVTAAVGQAERAVARFLGYDPVLRTRTEYYPIMSVIPQGGEVWDADENQAFLRRTVSASGDELQVRHLPVRATVAIDIRVDYGGRFGKGSGAFAASTRKTEGVDFWPNYDGLDDDGLSVCRDGIIRSIGQWPSEPGSIKITYAAGYSSDELLGTSALVQAGQIGDAALIEALRRVKRSLVLWKKDASAGHLAGAITSEHLGDYSYSVSPGSAESSFGLGMALCSEAAEALEDFRNLGWILAG